MNKKKFLSSLLAVVLLLLASFFSLDVDIPEAADPVYPGEYIQETNDPSQKQLSPEGSYTSKEDVALYLWVYGCLPDNFMTKKQAQALGWSGGSLEPYAPGCCIGGDSFGNYEGLLPEGPKYTECDIDTMGAKSRGAKRIVFSSDGYIYYTEDHYESFTVIWFTEDYEMKEAEVK